MIQRKFFDQNEFICSNKFVRLNKYLSNTGICSRRKADKYIQSGLVKINGKIITNFGTKVNFLDEVIFQNKQIQLVKKVYVLLNKPKNCITTNFDPLGRLTVLDLVKKACSNHLFPVGRLDRNTTGVLLLTNDGDLSDRIIHPSYKKKKIYHIWLNKEFFENNMKKLSTGIILDNEKIYVDKINYVNKKDKTQIEIEIHSGKNRIIRRLFENFSYRVLKLDRVYFAGLTTKKLKKGQWRFLKKEEIDMLYTS